MIIEKLIEKGSRERNGQPNRTPIVSIRRDHKKEDLLRSELSALEKHPFQRHKCDEHGYRHLV